LGIEDYQLIEEENGVIPMTDQPFPRRAGARVMNIGAKGGRVKPSTGYTFQRIQRDSAAIVQSLLRRGYPFAVTGDSAWYRLHDSIMLDVMARQGGQMSSLFTAIFRRNPIRRIFRFLDEAGSPLNDVALLVSLPPWPFLRALLRVCARRWTGTSPHRASLPARAASESMEFDPPAQQVAAAQGRQQVKAFEAIVKEVLEARD
jgi:lycopene beta-cyclase